jgi:nitrogen fixation protein FixH
MKLNWGTGIALVYGTFALSMIGVVFASRRYDPGLVSKDYYNLDLHYQEHMEKKQNAANLVATPAARYDLSKRAVVVNFPDGMVISNGSIKLFRSSFVGDDFTVTLEPNSAGEFEIPAADLHQGRWHVELDWVSNAKKYFYATSVLLPNA